MRREQNWLDTGEIWDPLILDIYPDRASTFVLYEDDKRTTYYQRGEYSKTSLSCLQASTKTEIIIGETSGDYKGIPESRKIVLKINLISSAPSIVRLNSGICLAFSRDSLVSP